VITRLKGAAYHTNKEFSMKNKLFSLLIVVLALACAFTACNDAGGSAPVAPKITELTVGKGTPSAFTPQTTFNTSEVVTIISKIDNPGKNIDEMVRTLFKGETQVAKSSVPNNAANAAYFNNTVNAATTYTYSFTCSGDSISEAGSYKVEFYVVDSNGNKSNVKTVSFTVS
jgi:hypothetical protein